MEAKRQSAPVILLSDEERRMLKDAWDKVKDLPSLIALQNDCELRKLQEIKRMKEEERKEKQSGWRFLRDVFSYASSQVERFIKNT